METDLDVIVVGGGLAGLAAASTAAQAGSRVVVLEAHQAGGRAKTVERQGFRLNMGGHALYVGGPGMAVLRALGVTPVGAPPPLSRYRALTSGTLHLLPTGPASLLRTDLFGARSKAQLVRLLGLLPRVDTAVLARTAFADWLTDRHLRPDAEAVVRALVRLSTYTDDISEFSADAAVAQLQLAGGGGVLYLHGGWEQLVSSLSSGLQVRTGVEVTGVDRIGDHVAVHTGDGTLAAPRVVLATGGPSAIRRLLPADPSWGDLGPPVTAACLDLGVDRVPEPGYVLSLDDPIYASVHSPPARLAPEGQALVSAIRYGSRVAGEDRAQLEDLVADAGVRTDNVVTRRFLASMIVSGTLPRASNGGLAGRPAITATATPGVVMAGDWVGPAGLLADAALASGQAAGRLAGRHQSGATTIMR
jgi:phytoene dehydrogenase-like protein